MNMTTNSALRYATRNLTGKRETDIAFLKEQITKNRFDAQIKAALERILNCISYAEGSVATA